MAKLFSPSGLIIKCCGCKDWRASSSRELSHERAIQWRPRQHSEEDVQTPRKTWDLLDSSWSFWRTERTALHHRSRTGTTLVWSRSRMLLAQVHGKLWKTIILKKMRFIWTHFSSSRNLSFSSHAVKHKKHRIQVN